MGPAINQLLEEAIQRSTDLAERSDAIAEVAAGIQEAAGVLGQLAEHEADGLHREVLDALQALGQAREQVDAQSDRASGVLDDLPGRGDEVESAARELLDGVRGDMGQLEDLRSRLLADVDKSREMVDEEFRQLAERVQRLQEKLESGLHEAADGVERLRLSVNDGRTRLQELQPLLREAIQSLPLLTAEKAQALSANLHAVMVLLGRNVFDVCERVLHNHNDALKALRTGFTGEAPGAAAPEESWVHESLQPLQDALGELGSLPAPAQDSLGETATSIVDAAYAAVMSAGEIAVALAQAVPDTASSRGD